jgi:hypothetical protein
LASAGVTGPIFAAAFMPAAAVLAWQHRKRRLPAASRSTCGRTSPCLTLSRRLRPTVASPCTPLQSCRHLPAYRRLRRNPHSVVQFRVVPCSPRVPSPAAFGRRPAVHAARFGMGRHPKPFTGRDISPGSRFVSNPEASGRTKGWNLPCLDVRHGVIYILIISALKETIAMFLCVPILSAFPQRLATPLSVGLAVT